MKKLFLLIVLSSCDLSAQQRCTRSCGDEKVDYFEERSDGCSYSSQCKCGGEKRP